jgi:hypothetical protein
VKLKSNRNEENELIESRERTQQGLRRYEHSYDPEDNQHSIAHGVDDEASLNADAEDERKSRAGWADRICWNANAGVDEGRGSNDGSRGNPPKRLYFLGQVNRDN